MKFSIDISLIYPLVNSTVIAKSIVEHIEAENKGKVILHLSCADYCVLEKPEVKAKTFTAEEAERVHLTELREILDKHGVVYNSDAPHDIDEWRVPENMTAIVVRDGYGYDVILVKQ